MGFGETASQFGGSVVFPDGESMSHFPDDDDRDIDASVRALRPRSSRRGSWESEASRWSARLQGGPGTPSLMRNGSLWATNSVRTGGFSVEMAGDNFDGAKEEAKLTESPSIMAARDGTKGDVDERNAKSTRFGIEHVKEETEETNASDPAAGHDAPPPDAHSLEVPRLLLPRSSVETIGTSPQQDDITPPAAKG